MKHWQLDIGRFAAWCDIDIRRWALSVIVGKLEADTSATVAVTIGPVAVGMWL